MYNLIKRHKIKVKILFYIAHKATERKRKNHTLKIEI